MRKLSFLGHLLADNDGIQVYVKCRKAKFGMPDYYVFEIIDTRHLGVVGYQKLFNNFKKGCKECLPPISREEFYKNTMFQSLI